MVGFITVTDSAVSQSEARHLKTDSQTETPLIQ